MSSSPVSMQQLVTFYERKTQSILHRYGPGPRVHYHTGFIDEPPSSYASAEALRSELIAGQERTLRYVAGVWNARSCLSGDILDVGCGLGGGAIFWAQEFGAQVTAITIAPSHIALVERFAAQARVECRVRPLLCDALAVPGEDCFDAAIAIDSSSSFPRRPWFRRLARLLRPGGYVFIFDCFLGRPEYEKPFNRHWCAQIGTIDEYLAAAREARLRPDMTEDVSSRALHFWTATIAFMRMEAREKKLSARERAQLEESVQTHNLVRQGLYERGLQHAFMRFIKD